jgi:hypothetical protein
MAITVAGIEGKEMWETFAKTRRDGQGPMVSLSYLVDFAQADAFADGVMGGVVASGDGTNWQWVPKLRCPTNPTLLATSVEIAGLAETNYTGNGRPEFLKAAVRVNFEIPSWPEQPSDDPGGLQSFPNDEAPGQPILYSECEIDYGGELVPMPKSSVVFTSDQKKIDVPMTKFVGVSTYRIVRQNLPYLPHSKIKSLRNKLNSETIFNEERGKVRFDGGRTKLSKTSAGIRVESFEMIFSVRDYDWNWYMRPDEPTFDEVSKPGDSTKTPYQYADLRPLLKL